MYTFKLATSLNSILWFIMTETLYVTVVIKEILSSMPLEWSVFVFSCGTNKYSNIHIFVSAHSLTNKEAKAVYYTVIKHDRHLRTLGKCRKHEPQASDFFISWVFSNARCVLSQCKYAALASSFDLWYRGNVATNSKPRFSYGLYSDKRWVFNLPEHLPGPIYNIMHNETPFLFAIANSTIYNSNNSFWQ